MLRIDEVAHRHVAASHGGASLGHGTQRSTSRASLVTRELCVAALALLCVVGSGCGGTTAEVLQRLGLTSLFEGSTGVVASSADSTLFEARVLVLINQRRISGAVCGDTIFEPVAPLTISAKLRLAARRHSLDMSTRGFFGHTNPDGDGPADRLAAVGYLPLVWGENIAEGQRTPEEVVAAWMNSPGHCVNVMEPNFTETGIGYEPGNFWTQDFGMPAAP